MDVLVDSSVWIAADRPRSKEHKQLIAMINGNTHNACVCALIRTEVCQGAREQGQFDLLWNGFKGYVDLPILEEHWEQSAWNFFRCKKRGLTLSTIDCLIATLSSSYRVPLWSIDKVFKHMHDVVSFELFDPSA